MYVIAIKLLMTMVAAYVSHRQCLDSTLSWNCSIIYPQLLSAALITADQTVSTFRNSRYKLESRADLMYHDYSRHL